MNINQAIDQATDGYWPVGMLAGFTGRSRATVWTWINAGEVKHRIIGGIAYVNVTDALRCDRHAGKRQRLKTTPPAA